MYSYIAMATTMKQQCNKAQPFWLEKKFACLVKNRKWRWRWSHGHSRIVKVRALGSSSLIARAAERALSGEVCVLNSSPKLNGRHCGDAMVGSYYHSNNHSEFGQRSPMVQNSGLWTPDSGPSLNRGGHVVSWRDDDDY